jgi:hypothetical protein
MSGQTYGGVNGSIPVYRCPDRGRCDEPSVINVERLDGFLRNVTLDRLKGLRIEATEDGVDVGDADKALEDAEAELRTFASDLGARRALGEAGWLDALSARAKDRDEKLEARNRAYTEAKAMHVPENLEELGQAEIRDLLAGLVQHVFVRRRPRGAGVDDRAFVVFTDDERIFDVPGPHRSGPFEPLRW